MASLDTVVFRVGLDNCSALDIFPSNSHVYHSLIEGLKQMQQLWKRRTSSFLTPKLESKLSGASAVAPGAIRLAAGRCDCATCTADWHRPEGRRVVRRLLPGGRVPQV